jgi:CheY-like chemotaxis protein
MGWLIMVTDITDRKRMEEKLLIAQQKAEDANRMKSEFVANMSHEIRTPMTAILGYADILADEHNQNLTPEQRLQYFETIKRNGKHLLTIVDDILDIAKIEAGKLTVERIRTDPVQVVTDVIDLMQVKAEAKSLLLECGFPTDLPEFIMTDPVRLRQILVNLVGNAIKFTEQGIVKVVVRYAPQERPEMRFVVSDTGIGMSSEACDRLFGSFEQADASTKRRFGGSGLGLRISQSLAHMLGGDISVVSKLKRGSTFTASVEIGSMVGVRMNSVAEIQERLELNRSLHSASFHNEAKPSLVRPLSGYRVLVAEDGVDNQRLIAFHLRRAGAEVRLVVNGIEALQAMGLDRPGDEIERRSIDEEFDLIVTDMQMPFMDGFELTRRLRAVGVDIPILALTAHAMSSDAEKCLDVGCNEHLSKPFDQTRLIQSCLRCLAG